jgi:antitoxin (DNA-binding transcriptional repressor) of toxin-antitoxin stability system
MTIIVISGLFLEFTVKSVNIAKFKSELSKYLGYVRVGEEVIVYNRTQPVAKIIPFKPTESKLMFEEPDKDVNYLLTLRCDPIKNQEIDSLKFLLEDRGER